jgi:trehalose 6-phosphate synthase/phosphatase
LNGTQVTTGERGEVEAAIRDARRAGALRFLFDYDGTLVPLASTPDLATPDAALLQLLERLASSPGMSIDIVSGRPRTVLDDWFGPLQVRLWAEHGLWRRQAPRGKWLPTADVDPATLEHVIPLLERFTRLTPGAHLERKSASVAWHYRGAESPEGSLRAEELRVALADMLKSLPLEILEGKKVIEVRFRGSTKAVVAHRLDAETPASAAIVAFGDDRTDEDLFRALPAASITVAVGGPLAGARYQLADYTAVRGILHRLLGPASTGFAR